MNFVSRNLIVAFLSIIVYWSCSEIYADDTTAFIDTSYTIQCAQRKEISPCNCYNHNTKNWWILVKCQKMTTFRQVIDSLRNRFDRFDQILLQIEYSNLEDLAQNKFKDIQTNIGWIRFHKNDLGTQLLQDSFEGIDTVTQLVLIDSRINQFPGPIFEHMPNMDSVTIERTLIKSVSPADFKSLKKLRNLIIKNCSLTHIESDTFPLTLQYINLSENNITTLNYTLRNVSDLEWLFLSKNNIESLEGQFSEPVEPNMRLRLLDISSNRLTKLPATLKKYYKVTEVFLSSNRLTSLDNIFRQMHKLSGLDVSQNRINQLSTHEFYECMSLSKLQLSNNEISNLNKSLGPLRSLEVLNLTYNLLDEFSIYDVINSTNLKYADLSHNKIVKFIGKRKTETETILSLPSIMNIDLTYNKIETLEGSLAEIRGLTSLNISHNRLSSVPTSFFDGMNELQHLDISYNLLHTLTDIAVATLPSLGYLYGDFNQITELVRDSTKGFSAVCFMYLRYNKIEYVSANFTDKNQCVYKPGVNSTLYVHMDGNEVLCKEEEFTPIRNEIESKNNTKVNGSCSSPNKRIEYNILRANSSNSETSPIIYTLDGKL